MNEIFAQIGALVTILITVAIFVEALLQSLAPLVDKFQDKNIRTSVYLALGAILGILAAWGMNLKLEDYFNFLPLMVPAWVSYVMIGCAAGAGGSRFWHAVLGFLGSVKLPKPGDSQPAG